jgi:hypothetical protein
VPGVRTSLRESGATPAPRRRAAPGRRTPAPARVEGGRALGRKGIGSRSPNRRRGTDRRGDAREPGDAGGGLEEGSLSSLTAARVRRGTRPDSPGIGSPGERAGRLAGRPSLRGVRDAPHRPLKTRGTAIVFPPGRTHNRIRSPR